MFGELKPSANRANSAGCLSAKLYSILDATQVPECSTLISSGFPPATEAACDWY